MRVDDRVKYLTIRKCHLVKRINLQGEGLVVIEMPFCELKEIPLFNAKALAKLNLSNNRIEELQPIKQLSTLKVLDVRNNHLKYISR